MDSDRKVRPPMRFLGKSGTKRLRTYLLPSGGKAHRGPFAVVTILGLLVGVVFGFTGIAQRLEWAGYDVYSRMRAAGSSRPSDIVVVAIDELSFAEIGLQWPWPRELHAALIRSLSESGAKAIVFDVVFDRPSDNPESDAELVRETAKAGNVVLAADVTTVDDQSYQVEQWARPFPALAEAASAVGHAKLPVDPDGTVRRALLRYEGVPSLALAAAQVSNKTDGSGAKNSLSLPRSNTPLVHFSGAQRTGVATVSYYQALDPMQFLPPGFLKDKIVFVGISLAAATGTSTATDHFKTPVSLQMSGVQIHADILDSLLRHRFISDPFGGWWGSLLLAVLLTGFLFPAFYRFRIAGSLLSYLGAAILLIAAGYATIAFLRVRIPVLFPLFGAFGALLSTSSYRFALGSVERRMILGAFKHYLAPALVDRMLNDPTQLRLGGAQYEVTVIFTDLAGFTTISEKLPPEELQRLLTRFFKEMMEILLSENATLDKFIGDAIMVYFGCPVAYPDHAARAARAAVRMQARMRELNEEWSDSGYPEIRMRVGINTGTVVAGNMGTDEIFNFTILGDNVNLASRLEGVNKEYGSLTIASEFCRAKLGDEFLLRELDWIRVKGKAEPVAIYEVCGLAGKADEHTAELHRRYASALAAYRARRFREAEELFTSALQQEPADGPSSTFLKRCRGYQGTPPPEDWDGVHVMTTK